MHNEEVLSTSETTRRSDPERAKELAGGFRDALHGQILHGWRQQISQWKSRTSRSKQKLQKHLAYQLLLKGVVFVGGRALAFVHL